ncbi:MAG TPA: uroporphyrinogen-III synthase [Ottowia sp.]|uniref:uroporphyrinogen-III synthase n=1 Tax=Ottowia sp. TaxID=1898956 RepID=UPI002CCB387F|nr:uroporphyrinogen-III synthase [Ottowia sp.]HMN21509.1 uroporphyrinogen-III synthase [Ottowia sp.]
MSGARALRLLVTRPAPGASAWMRELAAAGVCAEALPLIEIVAEPMAGTLRAAREQLGAYAAAMFVSGNAVAGFLRSGGEPALAAISTRAWSPGPGTTTALLQAGWPPERIDAPAADAGQFDSEALWTRVAAQVQAGRRMLIVRGADASGRLAGREWLAQQLQAAGALVEQVAAYRRAPARLDALQQARARAAARDGSWWLFSSRESVENLAQALPGVDWGGARALATHPRIAEAARRWGFGRVQETRPALPDVLASIESLA